MRQALHIFRKDVRFLWLPMLVVLAATASFCWSYAVDPAQAVTMHAVLSVTVYRRVSQSKARAGTGWTQVPGFGSILLQSHPQWTHLWWRRPLLQGPEGFVSTIQRADSAIFSAHEWGDPGGAEVFHFSPIVSFAAPFERPLDRSGEVVLPSAVEADVVVQSPAAVILRDLRIPNIRLTDWLSQD